MADASAAPPRQARRTTTPGEDFQRILSRAIGAADEAQTGLAELTTKIDALSSDHRPDVLMDLQVLRARLNLLSVRLQTASAEFDLLKVQH